MMNKKLLFLLSLGGVLFLPFTAFAAAELCLMVKRIQDTAWAVGGSIVVIGWVIAGILYLTAGGSPEKLTLARKAMFAAIIGTVLIVLSATASSIVISALGTGSLGSCGS